MVLNTEWAQVEVIDLINDGSGLAFGIIGGRSTGVVVKTILPGGVADRDGRLQSGDHILQIGEVNLRGLGSEQVASVLRQCGVHVRMVVARPVEPTSSDYQALRSSHAPIVPTKLLGDPNELDRHLIENGYTETFSHTPSNNYTTPYIFTGQHSDLQLHPISGLVDVVRDPLPIGAVPTIPPPAAPPVKLLPLDMAVRAPSLPETETFTVELHRDDLGLGITVAGYVCEREEISGIFVKSISEGSSAAYSKQIEINDRIVEVDGTSVLGLNNHQAVELLRHTGPKVLIRFERYLRGPKYEQLQQAIRANELRAPSPPSPSASSLPKIPLSLMNKSSLIIEPEGESRTSGDFDSAVLLEDLDLTPTNENQEIVIGGTKEERKLSTISRNSVVDKWKEILGEYVEIVIAYMNKDANGGLGISLEGTVDVEDGREVRPHHYIRSILPDGPVGMNGVLQSGDELIEVNSKRLLGLNHLEVVDTLKNLPGTVTLVCARYAVPTRIIDTAQHRDAFQARKILAGSLQTLIPKQEFLVKAKSDSSIASSVASITGLSGLESKSRSMEIGGGLPIWNDQPYVVELTKAEHGLGFSILDYQDPLNAQETMIVIRSLVPGGVAQADGRLIPGDRLLSVNDIDVTHSTLDRAVQVLKGAPKGIVKITVAKPIASQDRTSNSSQECLTDDQADHTCLDDFHECIEEYQECLEVVHICIEDEHSFNHSSCGSAVEDFGVSLSLNGGPQQQSPQHHCTTTATKANGVTTLKIIRIASEEATLTTTDTITRSTDSTLQGVTTSCDSDLLISTKREVNLTPNGHGATGTPREGGLVKQDSSISDNKVQNSLTFSKMTDDISGQDGYETCIDESLSDDQKGSAKEGSAPSSRTGAFVSAVQSPAPTSVASSPSPPQQTQQSEQILQQQQRQDSETEKQAKDLKEPKKQPKEPEHKLEVKAEKTKVQIQSEVHSPANDQIESQQSDVELQEHRIPLEESEVELEEIEEENQESEQHMSSDSLAHEIIICGDDKLDKFEDQKLEHNFLENDSSNIGFTASEPCLMRRIYSKRHHICLESSKTDDEGDDDYLNQDLKSYDEQTDSFGGDQFFLVEYIDDDTPDAVQTEPVPSTKWISEPNVTTAGSYPRSSGGQPTTVCAALTTASSTEILSTSSARQPTTYRRCLKEYYNDYAECLEAYRKHNEMLEQQQRIIDNQKQRELEAQASDSGRTSAAATSVLPEENEKEEMSDDEIFGDFSLPNRCRSAPDVLDSSFVMMTYDPGPELDKRRRKSAFTIGYDEYDGESLSMTVSRNLEAVEEVREIEISDEMLDKHWGPSRTVQVFREPNTSLGISIVGGKVNLSSNEVSSDAVLGIFVKNVVPESPAGKTGQFQTGDRILEVSGVNLRNVSHEKAVDTIRNAPNPVIFLVQSLTPWTSDKENEDIVSKKSSPAVSPNLKEADEILSVVSEKPIEFFSSEKLQASDVIQNNVAVLENNIIQQTEPSPKEPRSPETTKPAEVLSSSPPPVHKSPVSEPPPTVKSPEKSSKPTIPSRVVIDNTIGVVAVAIAKSESSDDSDDDEEDVRDMAGRTVTQKGREIDRASAGNVKRTKEEATSDPEQDDEFGYTTNDILRERNWWQCWLISTASIKTFIFGSKCHRH